MAGSDTSCFTGMETTPFLLEKSTEIGYFSLNGADSRANYGSLTTFWQKVGNLSDEVALAARLQNRTCTFQRIRLLNGLAVVISTSDEAWQMCFGSLNTLGGIAFIHRS